MGTRCNIGYEMKTGSIRHIYSHWDGYPTGVGKTLYDHYKNLSKVKELIDLGDISALGSEVGKKHPFDVHSKIYKDGKSIPNPDFDPKWENWTTAYGRDRGEKDIKAKVSATDEIYMKKAKGYDAEYAYLFKDGKWFVAELHTDPSELPVSYQFLPLGEILGIEKESPEEEIHGEDIYKYGTKEEIIFLKENYEEYIPKEE